MTERASFAVDPTDVRGLQEIIAKLKAIGYIETIVKDRLGVDDLADLNWRHLPMYRAERLAARDPLALAIDLLLLQGALPKDELDRLFTAAEQDLLLKSGILGIDGTARASLFPVGDRQIFSDHAWPELPHPGYTTVPVDHVMAVGQDSRHLARCTTRRPFRAALDLCTGSGIHALLASAHTERVLAVDINPRAACCTRFNAQALGIANLEVAVGDLFEPAHGERFDLITANPPFVPSPLDVLRFRDGGRSGEDVQKRIVAGLPDHLAPGGIAQIVTELGESDDGKPLAHRLREWLNGAPMDIHILRLREHTAAKYAIGHAKGDDFQTTLDSIDDWASNLRAQGYTRVVSLVVSFKWSDPAFGPPWERVDEAPPPRHAAGPEIEAAFLAERAAHQVLTEKWLSRSGPIALLDAQVLGKNLSAKAKATVLGRALSIEHQLDPLEREIVVRLEARTAMQELIRIFRDLGVDEPAVIAAVHSLLRRQLIRADASAPQG
jgi:methylase of polypeptide subunit release factors